MSNISDKVGHGDKEENRKWSKKNMYTYFKEAINLCTRQTFQ